MQEFQQLCVSCYDRSVDIGGIHIAEKSTPSMSASSMCAAFPLGDVISLSVRVRLHLICLLFTFPFHLTVCPHRKKNCFFTWVQKVPLLFTKLSMQLFSNLLRECVSCRNQVVRLLVELYSGSYPRLPFF